MIDITLILNNADKAQLLRDIELAVDADELERLEAFKASCDAELAKLDPIKEQVLELIELRGQDAESIKRDRPLWVDLAMRIEVEALPELITEATIVKRVTELKGKIYSLDPAAFGPKGENYRSNIMFRADNQQPEYKPYAIWVNEVYNDWYLTAKAAIESGLEVDITSGWPDEPEIRPES